VTAQLNAAINKVIVEPEINARLRQAGAEVTPMSIDQLAAFVRTEIENNQMILKATNLTAE
jgi:tripartite-type tricarboxylate transporter receptor subunit TctC